MVDVGVNGALVRGRSPSVDWVNTRKCALLTNENISSNLFKSTLTLTFRLAVLLTTFLYHTFYNFFSIFHVASFSRVIFALHHGLKVPGSCSYTGRTQRIKALLFRKIKQCTKPYLVYYSYEKPLVLIDWVVVISPQFIAIFPPFFQTRCRICRVSWWARTTSRRWSVRSTSNSATPLWTIRTRPDRSQKRSVFVSHSKPTHVCSM